MTPRRLPLPERILARRYLDGDAAEFVVGDLMERYEEDRAAGVSWARARIRLLRQTIGGRTKQRPTSCKRSSSSSCKRFPITTARLSVSFIRNI